MGDGVSSQEAVLPSVCPKGHKNKQVLPHDPVWTPDRGLIHGDTHHPVDTGGISLSLRDTGHIVTAAANQPPDTIFLALEG